MPKTSNTSAENAGSAKAQSPAPVPEADSGDAALTDGRDVIRAAVRNLPNRPGVYRMTDKNGNLLYVGKAKNCRL